MLAENCNLFKLPAIVKCTIPNALHHLRNHSIDKIFATVKRKIADIRRAACNPNRTDVRVRSVPWLVIHIPVVHRACSCNGQNACVKIHAESEFFAAFSADRQKCKPIFFGICRSGGIGIAIDGGSRWHNLLTVGNPTIRIQNRDAREAAAAIECSSPDARHAGRDADAREAAAAQECRIPDALYTIRDGDAREAAAVMECKISDACHAVRDHKVGDQFAIQI